MKETVLVTGASGALAKKTCEFLKDKFKLILLTTNKKKCNNKNIFYWNTELNIIDYKAFNNCQHIIHLAGFSVLNRWSKKNKNLMYSSRVNGAKLLFKTCEKLNIKPKTFVSASAIGIYGFDSGGIINEKNKLGNDWLAKMATDWEKEADNFYEQFKSRTVKMRISLLIDKDSGILKYNLLSMRTGLGVILGNKQSVINWIHILDAANFINIAITNKNYSGAYNLATEKYISQESFFKTIKKILFPYSIIISIPLIFPKLILGKRVKILDFGNKIMCVKKLKKHNFNWKYKEFGDVINSIKK